MPEERRCPNCRMLMVKRFLPPTNGMHRYSWWCGCGHEETGGIQKVPTREELLEKMWGEKNLKQEGVPGRMARHRLFGRPL